MVVSDDSNLVLFWWSTSGNEVFPWAPHLKEEDRANIMIFGVAGSELKRIGFTRTNTDPVAIRSIIRQKKSFNTCIVKIRGKTGNINIVLSESLRQSIPRSLPNVYLINVPFRSNIKKNLFSDL